VTARQQRFLAGLAAGVVLGVLSLIFGLIAMATVLMALTALGLVLRRPPVLAGGWVGMGGTWLVLIGRAALDCARPEMPCGATPPDTTWLLLIALTVAVGGLVVGVASWRSAIRA
jgi:hypothetical protein